MPETSRRSLSRLRTPLAAAALLLALSPALLAQDAAPKKQLPADQRAFAAARALQNPTDKLAALREFVRTYPDSSRIHTAQSLLLETLLKEFPDRVDDIHKQAELEVKAAGNGFGKYRAESDIAFHLADASANGIDLPYAEKLAEDAARHLDEKSFDKYVLEQYSKEDITPPGPDELHAMFSRQRAQILAPLACVLLEEGKQAQAIPVLDEGYALDPHEDDINALRGRVAMAQGKDAEALADFERAVLVGNPTKRDRASMLTLFKAQHGGTTAGMDAELDVQYAALFPAAFHPAAHTAAAAGHTALLELFTGSGCPPCVAGDLAVEGLLDAYPRTALVALAFDQHIPEPDPLTNPDSVARARVYGVSSTPSYILDGNRLPIYGGTRADAEKLYGKLEPYVAAGAALPTGASLELTASRDPDGMVHAQVSVHLAEASVLAADADRIAAAQAAVKAKADAEAAAKNPKPAPKPAPAAPARPAADARPAASPAAQADAAKPAGARYVVNFALVEDDIRYSGENGVRFHRMVVRALARPAAEGFPASPGASTSAEATFNPSTISTKWAAYLDDYSEHNDRFGKFKFLSTDTTMQPAHLAVVAWVQDSTTHRVLDATFMPLSPSSTRLPNASGGN